MTTFSIKESFRVGWRIVKANFWFVIGTTFVYYLFNPDVGLRGDGWKIDFRLVIPLIVLGIAIWIVGIAVQIGYTRIYLKLLDGGERPRFRELFTHWYPYWRYIGSIIVYCLRVIVGFLLLIVPGIIWAIKFQFAYLLVIDKDLGIMEAMRRSAEITSGHKWHLFKFGLAAVALNILGFFCFVVGLLVTLPLTMLAYLHIYRVLDGNGSLGIIDPTS